MINLLPGDTKTQIRAARANVTLYRYCLLVLMTAIVLGGVFAVGFWANLNDRQLADTAKAEAQSASDAYAKTRSAAESFAKDLSDDKAILAVNVNFTKLIFDIAAVVPTGVILNNLTLSTTAKADAPIDVSGRAVSYDAAVSLKNSLEASPIFEKVSIVNVSQTDTSQQTQASPLAAKYPFIISLKAQFTKQQGATQ